MAKTPNQIRCRSLLGGQTATRDQLLLAIVAVALSLPGVGWASCKVKSLELPVTMVGSRALATVGINGRPVKLALDSGAFYSFLTEAAAADLQLPLGPVPAGMQIYGVTGRVDVKVATVKRLQLLDGELSNVEFIVGGNEPGRGAMGLMGRNLLSATDTEYDLANGVVRFMLPQGDCEKTNLAYWAGSTPVSEIELRGERSKQPAIVGTARLNGKEIDVLFDTGATSVLKLATAKNLGMAEADMKSAGRIYGAGRGEARAWIAPIDSFELGSERINNSRLMVADFKLEEDMLLGIDFFLSHRIYVSKLQRRMYFTYNGGPIFALNSATRPPQSSASAASAASAPEPLPPLVDAAAYARRGAASASRRDFERALADLSRACELEPTVASHFTQRGMVYLALRQNTEATRDFDTALQLNPDDADSRLQRAVLRERAKDLGGAVADLQTLDKTLTPQSQMRMDMASMYSRNRQYDQALSQLNHWIAAHGNEVTLHVALNARCWARAMLDVELEQALDDCNAAVHSQPKNISYLDSRAWVQVRRGQFKDALSDYDRALKIGPLPAWSLYGRGIARTRLGDLDHGKEDLSAARLALPTIDADAGRFGISAP